MEDKEYKRNIDSRFYSDFLNTDKSENQCTADIYGRKRCSQSNIPEHKANQQKNKYYQKK